MNKLPLKTLLFFLIFFTAATVNVSGQAYNPGDILIADRNLPLRTSPPQGLLNEMAGEAGELHAGDRVRVVQTKNISTLFSRHIWLLVERIDPTSRPTDQPDRQFFWVYAGRMGQEQNLIKEGE